MIRLPNDTQRIAVLGRTGSGKTVAAVWHLSQRNLDARPWVIYDFKYDKLINEIERAEHVDLDWKPGKKDRGIFIVHPLPDQEEEVQAQMWQLWERGNVGVYVDEGYMIDRTNRAYDAMLTQGRARHIPMIILSQRPAWISRFVWSESDFFQVFHLSHNEDRKTVGDFVPGLGKNWTLEKYHSYYFDVSDQKLVHLMPVPKGSELLDVIDEKLDTRKRRTI